MRDTKTGIFSQEPYIDKTGRALRKTTQIAKEMTEQKETIRIQQYSSDESEIGDENPRITLRNYGRLDNLDKLSLGFQPANHVVFNIKNSVIINLKSNQFLGKESEDRNAHLTHFMDACSTINPLGLSKSYNQFRLFGYSLTRLLEQEWFIQVL